MKKILVVYYSRDGRNQKIAHDLQQKLDCDIEEIVDLKNRHGWLAWWIAGYDAAKERPTKIKTLTKNPADYDLVIIGSPIWVDNLPPAIHAFIDQYQNHIKKLAFYQCYGGSGADKSLAKMKAKLGSPLAHFIVRKANLETDEYNRKLSGFIDEVKQVLS